MFFEENKETIIKYHGIGKNFFTEARFKVINAKNVEWINLFYQSHGFKRMFWLLPLKPIQCKAAEEHARKDYLWSNSKSYEPFKESTTKKI